MSIMPSGPKNLGGGGSRGPLAAGQSAVTRLGSSAGAYTGIAKAVMVLVGIGLLSASAYLSVPFYPVPLTMQTLAVLLIGGTLGPVLGASSVAGYLALGVAGAPVFHNGLGGPAVLAGPTGGYLIGFIAAAFVMGLASRGAGRTPRLAGLVLLAVGALAASATVYAFGVPWLAVFTGGDLRSALAAGAVPFILGDLLKSAVAVAALRMGGDALTRVGRRLVP